MSTTTEWTILERLLLAQAVNKYGENNWSQVERTLRQHPLLQGRTQLEIFSQKNCSLQYSSMIEAIDSESAPDDNVTSTTQHMPKVVKLARQLYFQRVEELKRVINQDEDRFVALLAEIDDMKSGNTTNTADESQASPSTLDNEVKTSENNEINTQAISTDSTSTLKDTEMDETQKTPVKSDHDMDTHQHAATPMDVSPQQNETTGDHVTDDTREVATTDKDAISTDKAEGGSSSTILHQSDDASVSNLEQTGHEAATSESMMETPSAKETLTPPSPALPEVDNALAFEPSFANTKRPPTDITSPGSGLDQHITLDSPSKRQKLDQPDIPRSPSFSTPAQPVDNPMESGTADEDLIHNQANTDKTPIVAETPEADQPENDHVETNQSPAMTITSIKSPTSSLGAEMSVIEKDTTKNESPAANVITTESTTDTQILTTETGEGEEEGDNLSLSLKDVDGSESLAGSDSNAATPSAITTTITTTTTAAAEVAPGATMTTTSEKRRSASSGNIKDDPRQKSWQKNVNLLWREIANHKNGAMFMNPIKEAQAPLYYDVVKYPLDLKTIKNRIRDGVIRTTVEFERDVVLMLTNSLMYNKEGTEIYQMAHEMLQDVTEQIKIFKTADGNSSTHTKGVSILTNDRRKSLAE